MSDDGKWQTSSGKDRCQHPSTVALVPIEGNASQTLSLWLEVCRFPEYRLLPTQIFPHVELYQKSQTVSRHLCHRPTSDNLKRPESVWGPLACQSRHGVAVGPPLLQTHRPRAFLPLEEVPSPSRAPSDTQGWAFSEDRSASASSHKADQRGPSNERDFSPK